MVPNALVKNILKIQVSINSSSNNSIGSMKTCKKCGETKDISEYYIIKHSGNPHGSCKECFKKSTKASKEKLGKEHTKDYMLKYTYGISLEQYNSLPQECGICGSKEEGRGYKMNVDHDHKTGKVRGLLCNSCNRGLGLLGEDNLEEAIRYLERSKQLELS